MQTPSHAKHVKENKEGFSKKEKPLPESSKLSALPSLQTIKVCVLWDVSETVFQSVSVHGSMLQLMGRV